MVRTHALSNVATLNLSSLSSAHHPMIQERAGCLILEELHRFGQRIAARIDYIDYHDKPIVAPPQNKPFVHSGPFGSAHNGRFRSRHHDWLGSGSVHTSGLRWATPSPRRRRWRRTLPFEDIDIDFYYVKLTGHRSNSVSRANLHRLQLLFRPIAYQPWIIRQRSNRHVPNLKLPAQTRSSASSVRAAQ